MSTIKSDNIATLAGVTTSMANAVNGSAKAWVNFNGTGTVAIRASYNVTSITDNGTGDYTVNFTTAMANANYSTVVGGSYNDTRDRNFLPTVFSVTTSSVRVGNTSAADGAAYDAVLFNVAIFR